MFRKIYLSYFPEDESKNSLSPLQFHLKLLSPKLLYAISSKLSLNNRRSLQIDSKIHYFHSHNFLISKSIKEENFFYSYKIFAGLNGYQNYGIHTILAVVILISFYLYYDYIDDDKISDYLNPILYSINYLMLIFFSHFKHYPYDSDKENLQFMIKLLRSIIFHLEYTKKTKQNVKKVEKFTDNLLSLIKTYPDFLMFLYKLTKRLYNYFAYKPYTDINLYEYLVSANLMDFPNEAELRGILKESSKKIFIKRGTNYIDQDIITLLNVISGENMHISYIFNNNSLDFLPYFIDSLDHLENISLDDTIEDIIDKVFDFKIWSDKFIKALKDFNADNIDIEISPGQGFEQIQDIMTKEMMDNVKKVSLINEQFLDYFIYLISLNLNNNSDNSQFEFLYDKDFSFLFDISLAKNKDIYYILADKNYFSESYFYKNKKEIKKPLHYYNFSNKLLAFNINTQAVKTLLNDFNKKIHIETINSGKYKEMIKIYFYKGIKSILSSVNSNYLDKYFGSWIKNVHFTDKEIKNFKGNIYYPDFLVWYEFLKFNKIKIKKNQLILYSRLKETLLGYLIVRNLIGLNNEFELEYISALSLALIEYNFDDINFDLEKFYEYFYNKYPEFINFFSSVKQNKEFISILMKNFQQIINLRGLFLRDNLRDVTYYNKRLFKL